MPDRRRSTCLAVLAVVGAIGPGSALARHKAAICPTGRFIVTTGGPFVPGADPSTAEVVEIADGRVTVGGCPPVRANLKATSKGTRVKATWTTCPGVIGKAVLKGVIRGGCQTMDGSFRARRAQIKRSFAATLDGCAAGCQGETRVKEAEPNNSPGNATLVGTLPVSALGAITPGTDHDYFAIPVTAGSRLHLETFDASGVTCSGVDTYLELCDPDLVLLASSNDDGIDTCSSFDSPILTRTATYFARVLSLHDTSIAAYRLRISVIP